MVGLDYLAGCLVRALKHQQQCLLCVLELASFEINIACCAISISKSDLTSISALASGCIRRGAIIVQARKLVRKFAPLPRSQVTLDSPVVLTRD